MKHNKLKITVSMMLIVLCLFVVALFTGCNKEAVTDLYITNANAPRTAYVQGQELDLSKGAVTYVVDGVESVIPLTDEGVAVTGYDKTKLGAQTLTITYMEKSVTVNVNVVPRITAENYETKYFIDAAFDKTKGKLRIANDDATTFTVNMNDNAVSLVSFNPEKEGETNVTVKYEKNGASYECTFPVNVYGIASVTFTPPTKKSYASHDTELDFAGGYLTVKATDASLSMYVNLTKDMLVEQPNFSAATKENWDTPFTQELVFQYGNQTFNFNIAIKYSGISCVNDAAALLTDIVWDSEDAAITTEQGEATIEALTAYYELSKADKVLIPKKNIELVVRAAAIYVGQAYRTELETYKNTISLSNDGGLYLVCKDYEKTMADYARLKDEDEKLNVYATILRNLLDDFADVVIVKDVTVEQIVMVLSEDIQFFLIDLFKHLSELHELLIDVDKDWTIDTLREHGDDILIATMNISSATYVNDGYGYFYTDILSGWREKDDYLDILYSYFVFVEEDEDFILNSMWEKVPLPGIMNDWYNHIVYALSESNFMDAKKDSTAYLYDVTQFMYFHKKAVETDKAIKTSDYALYTELYDILGCEYILDHYVRAYKYGYLYHCGSMIDSPAFAAVWDNYLTLIEIYKTSTLDLTGNDAEFRATLNAFLALSPSELYGFLSSLNFQYDTSRGSVLVTHYSKEEGTELQSIFIDMMGQYAMHVLTDANEPLLNELFAAMENFALLDIKATAIEDFKTVMGGLITKYNALSAADRENFDRYLGTAYTKYLAIYETYTNDTPAGTGDKEAAFNEFYDLITKFYEVYSYLEAADEDTDTTGIYGLLIALYERANLVYDDIVSFGSIAGNEEILTALYANLYQVDGDDMTLDNAFFGVRTVIVNYMFNTIYKVTDSEGKETTHVAWDVYSPSNAKEFFAKAAYFMYASFNKEYPMPEKDELLALMDAFLALYEDKKSLNIFCAFDGDVNYYASLRSVLEASLSETGMPIAKKLLDAEIAYISYLFTEDEEHLSTFKTLMAEIIAAYDTDVTASDREYVADMYTYYVTIYNELDEEAVA